MLKARVPYKVGDEIKLRTIVEGADTLAGIPNRCILSIDGSTTNTGMAFMDEQSGELLCCMSVSRDSGCTPVRYKVELKRLVAKLLRNNKNITSIYYEEPCISYATAVPNLFMLKTFTEELVIENEPEFDYLKYYEVNNKRWKKLFLEPDKCPNNSEAEKKAVRNKLLQGLPFLSEVTQDEIDAICMGYVACVKLKEGKDPAELESKKAARAFNYEITFIGANTDDDMATDLIEVYDGPQEVLDNGIELQDLPRTVKFDKHIYQSMGDNDKLLIFKFKSSTHGDLILKYRLGFLATEFEYLYAVVWRKTRKKQG